jgi:hypothetical protein
MFIKLTVIRMLVVGDVDWGLLVALVALVVWGFFVVACFRGGLPGLPLCGAAPTFFAAAKKVGKESRSNRQCLSPRVSHP